MPEPARTVEPVGRFAGFPVGKGRGASVTRTVIIGSRNHHLPIKKEELKQSMAVANSSTNVLTETHDNIVKNPPLAKSDFIQPVPEGLKLEAAN